MHYIFYFFLFFLSPSPAMSATTAAAQDTATNNKMSVSIAISEITYDKYRVYMNESICSNIPDLTGKQIDRNLLELFLICFSFNQQLIAINVNLIPVSNYLRAIRMVQLGLVHTIAESVWSSDISESDVYATIPTLRTGEFEKGIYAHVDHPIHSIAIAELNLSDYIGTTFKSWVHDWSVINSLTAKNHQIGHLPSLFKILQARRGDFTLMEFPSTEDLIVEQGGILLKPINGIKVQMPDSRKLIVSKKAANGKIIFQHLNNGLQQLRNEDKIRALYLQVGFINANVTNWKKVN